MSFEYSLSAKWLQLLKEVAPGVRRVGVLRDLGLGPAAIGQWAVIQAAAEMIGVEVIPLAASDSGEIERSIAKFADGENGGLIVTVGSRVVAHREAIIAGAAEHRLPTVYPYRHVASGGGLISYGPDLTDQCRRAAAYVDRILRGEKPGAADRKSKRSAPSVLDVVQAYLRHAKLRQRVRSYEETERHLLKHAAPLHHDRAEAVRRADITRLLDRVSETAGPFAANRLRASLSALWSWGMRAGLIDCESNPVTLTLRHPEKARDRTLSDAELRAIWTASEGDGDYARIVRLCILTGCRRDEIGGLRWDEVLPDRLLIGAERMKAGSTHEVPLLPAIMAALPERPEQAEGSVFGRHGTGFSGWSKSKAQLDRKLAKAGVKMTRWTLHDLRRTLSTRLHDAGVEPLVIEALLAHKQQGVAAVYNRASFREAKRAALTRWHEIVSGIVS